MQVEGLKNVQNISARQARELMMFTMLTKRVMMLWGPPGSAKSASAEAAARDLMHLIERKNDIKLNFVLAPTASDWMKEDNFCFGVVYGSTIEETETRGLPFRSRLEGATCDITEYTPTSIFPLEGVSKAYGVVFFDELSATKQHIQSALQNVLLDRKAGDRKLSDKVYLLAAGNRPGLDGGSGNDLIDSLKARLKHYQIIHIDRQEWMDIMASIGKPIDIHVSGFLLSIGAKYWELSKPSDPDQYTKGNLRSWEFASNDIKALKDQGKMDGKTAGMHIAGWIGQSAGMDFAAWYDATQKVNFADFEKDPSKVNNHSHDIGLMYGISVDLSDKIIQAKKDKKKLDLYLSIVEAMNQKEFGMFILAQVKAQGTTVLTDALMVRPSLASKYVKEIQELEQRMRA